MKNILSKLWSLSWADRVRTLAIDAVSLPSFCRVNMLKLVSILVILLTLGVGNAWGATTYTYRLVVSKAALTDGGKYILLSGDRTKMYNNNGTSSGHLTTSTTVSFSSSATSAGSAVTTTTGASSINYVTLIKISGDTYKIYDSGGSYIVATKASSGGFKRETSDSNGWTFYGTSGLDAIYEKSYTSKYAGFRYRSTSSDFRSYQAAGHTSPATSESCFYLASGFSVTYDGNGKTSGTVPSDSYLYGEGATITVKSNSGSLAKTGYTFSGWNTKADGTGDNYTAGSGSFTVPSGKTTITLYAKWVSAAPACGAPTGLTKGSINASSQTVSWTAPGSAPANGYLVAYSTATDQNPADNVYSTIGNYTVISVSAGTTTANIPCNSAGTYNWWVRSKCSADNSSLSGWVKGTAFTMKQIYLKIHSDWDAAGAKFAAYYWVGSPATKEGFTKIMTPVTDCESGIYTCVFPTDYSNVIFVRMSSAQTDPITAWTNKLNQTSDQTLPNDSKDYFTISGGSGDAYTGSWGTYARKYQIDFDLNKPSVFTSEPSTAPAARCVTTGTTTDAPTNAQAMGKQITGWYKEAGCSNQWVFASQQVSGNQTLYAKWEDVSNKTIYLDCSATLSGSKTWDADNTVLFARAYINGTQLATEVKMTSAVSTCDAHVYAFSIPGNATHVSFARCATGTTELPADWATNPPVYNAITGKTVESGKDWYKVTDWGSADLDNSPFAATTYTISYNKGSATYAGGNTIDGSKSNETKNCDIAFTLPSSAVFSAEGYTQTSWATSDGGSSAYSLGGSYTSNADQAFYPVWTINSHTLAWEWNGGSTSGSYTAGGTKNYGTTITYPANGTMSKTGYNFTGWTTDPTGTPTKMPDADLTITANWSAKTYSNTLDREGGTTGSTSVTTTYNSTALTSYTAPTKTGYTFGGYWSGDDGTGTEVINTSGALKASVTVSELAWTNSSSQWVKDGAVTMYAKWTAKNYTVTLNDGSGSGGSGSKSVTYDSNTNLTTNVAVPTYAGNDFRGYYTSTGGGGTKVIDGNGAWIRGTSYVDASGNWVYDGSPTLHAYYTTYEYENYRTQCGVVHDITLDDGEVATTNNGSAKVAEGSTTIYSIVAPTKNGYDIEGYYTTNSLTTKIATTAGVLSASITVSSDAWTDENSKWVLEDDATFYTKWNAHTYTLTYEGLEGASNTNPTSYNIETATIVLANPGNRTGYTFTGWTCGGDAITQIALGSTGDKTITANWTINTPNLAVSAADHVVITATPASESAIAEGANRNVNYNKTITLNCTPDSHWNLEWDVYKTGESSTKVALTGSGDGATFAMPDYAVTVTAVMTEDTYHTATFMNNGTAIDGYDAVKTYDGTKPSAPTLTDVTDACDKTDCNKFYGWIAEDGIWDETIDDVSGMTIYRNASNIPSIDGADVVYHAVWAKGSGVADIPTTLIAKWNRQELTASTAVYGVDKNGNTLNGTGGRSTVTLTSSESFGTSANYTYNANPISDYTVTITIAGLNYSNYSKGGISFYTRYSATGTWSIKTSSNGSSYSDATTLASPSSQEEPVIYTNIPNTTTHIQLIFTSASKGSLNFGTVRAYGINTSPTYTFTKLTSANTDGWENGDWDGFYMITGNSSTKALRSDGIQGSTGLTTVAESSTDVMSTSDIGLIFKVNYSSGNGYVIQGLASGDYINTNKASKAYQFMTTSQVYLSSIGYNDIEVSSGNHIQWNSTMFGVYSNQTAPTLYKIMSSFTEFRITCCATKVNLTHNSPSNGSVAFSKTKVSTCDSDKEVTLTIAPDAGYKLTGWAVNTTSGYADAKATSPAVTTNSDAVQNITLTFAEDANKDYDVTATFGAIPVSSLSLRAQQTGQDDKVGNDLTMNCYPKEGQTGGNDPLNHTLKVLFNEVLPANALDKAYDWSVRVKATGDADWTAVSFTGNALNSNTIINSFNKNTGTLQIKSTEGTAEIKITAHDGSGVSAKVTITVANVALSSLNVAKSETTLYEGESESIAVSYDPVNTTTKGYTTGSYTYVTISNSSTNTNIILIGKATASVQTETVTLTSNDAGAKTATIDVTVKPLPIVTFADIVHNKTDFAVPLGDGSCYTAATGVLKSTVTDGVVSHTKHTPSRAADVVVSGGNECEQQHLHLIGWIRSDYSKVVNYLAGTGAKPTITEITSAGTDGDSKDYYFVAGESINVETYNGFTFYAVWAKMD